MKTLKIYLLTAVLSITFGCSKDSETDSVEKKYQIEISEENSQTRSENVLLLIEWYEDVSSERKDIVRRKYTEKNILIKTVICDNTLFETWTINCLDGQCYKESDIPVDTQDDDIKRVALHITCEDIKNE